MKRKVVRGGTLTELNKRVARLESTGWVRITENKLDDSMSSYGVIDWVCVMELRNGLPDKKSKWELHI